MFEKVSEYSNLDKFLTSPGYEAYQKWCASLSLPSAPYAVWYEVNQSLRLPTHSR